MPEVQPRVTAALVSWRGMHDPAAAIATALDGVLDGLTVIYSNPEGREETGAGTWVQAAEEDFFGRKFQALAAQVPPGNAMLLIQADASCDDWPGLARRWAQMLARHPGIGVWTPQIDNTAYPFSLTAKRQWPQDGLCDVVQTDGIVLGIAPAVLDRLRALDYSQNNLGWGIDWAAVAFCGTQGLAVVGDPTVRVSHPASRGYADDAARWQMEAFFTQLTDEENRIRSDLLRNLRQHRRARSGQNHGQNHLLIAARKCAAACVDPGRLGTALAGLQLVAGRLLIAPRAEAGPLGVEADGQPLSLVPADPAAVPRVITLAPSDIEEGAVADVTGQLWSCPGQATTSLAFPPQTGLRRVPLCAPVDLPPEAGDLTLVMGLAVHRGYGNLVVAWHDRDDPAVRHEHFIRFDPAFTGTEAEGDYQAVRLRIPASAGPRILTFALSLWPEGEAAREPLVFMLTAPVLLPTALAEAVPVPLIVTGNDGIAPVPGWLEARVPAGAQAVDLRIGDAELALLRATETPARLQRTAEPGVFEASAAYPCPALLCLDGRPTRLLWLGPSPQRLELPHHPDGQGVSLSDVTGSLQVAILGDRA